MSTTCLHLVPALKMCVDDKMLNPEVHKSWATKFSMVVPNIYGSCVMELA